MISIRKAQIVNADELKFAIQLREGVDKVGRNFTIEELLYPTGCIQETYVDCSVNFIRSKVERFAAAGKARETLILNTAIDILEQQELEKFLFEFPLVRRSL